MAYKVGASGIVSTFANFSDERSGIRVKRGEIVFSGTSGAVQTAVGSALTVVDTFSHDTTDGDTVITGDFAVAQTNLIRFDGIGGHTYISEESNSNLKTYVSGSEMINVTNDGHFFSGFAQFPEYLYHKGDTHTYIRFTADRIRVNAGGVEMLDIVEAGAGTATYVDICDRVRVQRDGDLLCEGDVIANSSTAISDRKLKENIKPITNAVEKVMTLGGVTYNWKKDGGISAGVIAQDVEEVLPEVVKEKVGKDGEEFKTVNYDGLVGLLIEGMKEQQTIINRLEERINTLEKERE